MLPSSEKHSSELEHEGRTSSNDALLEQDESVPEYSHRKNTRSHWVLLLTTHFVLFVLNAVLFAMWTNYPWKGIWIQERTISPVVEAIKYESRYFEVPLLEQMNSPYVGEPREELDEAWHELLKNTNIAVPEQTMRDLGVLDKSILLPDGSGYLAMIFAHHQLHCIKRLHHYMYESHYFPNLTAREAHENRLHNFHCLDLLRQTVMCNADISLITMRWGHTQQMPLGNFSTSHTCRSWDAIDQWAGEHAPKRLMEPGWLKHPTFGDVVSEGNRRKMKLGVTTEDW